MRLLPLLLLAVALPSRAAADLTWTGLGDGTSWGNPANWSGGVAPGPADDVLLDHSAVAATYTVTLPAGTTTVAIHRLRISPGAGAVITVVLPSANTANPGLRVGDGLAGTDDIVLDSSAVLKNASGATTGNGIEAQSIANGTVRINNGGRYVHASLRSSSGISPMLSTVPGTETGEFEYDVPGTNAFNIAASGRTYGSLVLTRSAGNATYGALGGSPWTVRGRIETKSGVTLASTMTAMLSLGGDFVVNGEGIVLPPNQPVTFTGAGVHRVMGVRGLTLNGPVTIPAGVTVAIVGTALICNNTTSIAGELRLDQGATASGVGPYSYDGATGTLTFNPTMPSHALDGRYWPATNTPAVVQVIGAGGIRMLSARTVNGIFRTLAPVLDAQLLTFEGLASLQARRHA